MDSIKKRTRILITLVGFTLILSIFSSSAVFGATKSFTGELKYFNGARTGDTSYYNISTGGHTVKLAGVDFSPSRITGKEYKCYYTGTIPASVNVSHCNASSTISGVKTFTGELKYFNGSRYGETSYRYITVSGGDIKLTSTNLYPSVQNGIDYKCYYTGNLTGTYEVSACGMTTSDPTVPVTPPATPSTPTTPATPAATLKAEPMPVGLQIEKNTPVMATTKCDGDIGKTVGGKLVYANGILEGVPCNEPITELKQVVAVIKNVLNKVLLPTVGTLFTIMVIVGGIGYITSNGNEQRATKAKGILTAAIIGLLISVLAYVIVYFFAAAIGGGIS